jgi:hypothetical protein
MGILLGDVAVTADLMGEGLVRLNDTTPNGGTYTKVMLWNGTTLSPIEEAKTSVIE